MTGAELVFWGSLFLVVHTYFFYPCMLFAAYAIQQIRRDLRHLVGTGDRRCVNLSADELPSISLVIPAHNEADCLPAKLRNIRAMDYPPEKLEVVFVSDGSTDATNEILERAREPGLQVVILPHRRGKASAVNCGVARASHGILVFSDASTLFARDALLKMARHFSCQKVGVVCGALRFQGNLEHRQTEGVYWKYESAIRLMEGRLGATLTASGAIYAVRREAFRPLGNDVLIEDFVVPMAARRAGYQVVYDPEACGSDVAGSSVAEEYSRRVRIAMGSFKALREVVNTRLNPFTYFAFFCHKFLRWTLPLWLLGVLLGNALLASHPFYQTIFVAQSMFYLWAGAGYLFHDRLRSIRYALLGYFLVSIHLAYLVGLTRFLTGRHEVAWERAQRAH